MSAQRFSVSDVNPNDACGGGGCLCSETKVPEAEGPYVIFYSQETNSNLSPHPVLCGSCLKGLQERDIEALSAGERDERKPADADAELPEV